MNTVMLMSKFISMKTTTRVRLNCGLTILEFAELTEQLMMDGQFFVLEHILKLPADKSRGSLVNHGSLKETGNCLMGYSKK